MSQYQRKLCFPWATLLFLLSGWISYFILRYGPQEAYGQTAAHLYLMTIITISSAYLIPAHIWHHHIFSFWDTLLYLFYLVVLQRFLLAATILFLGIRWVWMNTAKCQMRGRDNPFLCGEPGSVPSSEVTWLNFIHSLPLKNSHDSRL